VKSYNLDLGFLNRIQSSTQAAKYPKLSNHQFCWEVAAWFYACLTLFHTTQNKKKCGKFAGFIF
jgi:hypothetical protein